MYYRLKLYYYTLGTFEPIEEQTLCSKEHIQSTIRKFSKKHISPAHLQTFFRNTLYSISDNRLQIRLGITPSHKNKKV